MRSRSRADSSFRPRHQTPGFFPFHAHEQLQRLRENLRVLTNAQRNARVVVIAAFGDLVLQHFEEVVVSDSGFHFSRVVDHDVAEDEPGQAPRFVVFLRLDRQLLGVPNLRKKFADNLAELFLGNLLLDVLVRAVEIRRISAEAVGAV